MAQSTAQGLGSRHVAALHTRFLVILPRVELHGRIYFRSLALDEKAEAVQEMRALAWKWYLRLHERGKDPVDFLTTFVPSTAVVV